MLEIGNKTNMREKRGILGETIALLFMDKLYLIVLITIFIKSLLFIGFLGTSKAMSINLTKGFFSVPPYLIYLGFVMAMLSVSFLFSGRGHLWSLIFIDILISALFVGDIWYYRGHSGFLNLFLIDHILNADNIVKYIISVLRPIDLIFGLDIVALILFTICNRDVYKGVKTRVRLFLLTLIIPVCYLSYIHYKVDVYQRCFFGQTAFMQSWAPTQTMSSLGPIGYHLYDSYEYYKNSTTYKLTETDKQNIVQWYAANNENLPDNKYAGMFKGKNLLVIQVESLENFVINQKIDNQEITPTLNKLLKNSLYFNNYHENVYNGTSSDSDLLTNTGLYPVREGSTFFRYPNNTYKYSLPNVLEGLGYDTLAIHPDKGSYWNWMPSLKSIGFNTCLDETAFKSYNPIGLGLSDEDLMSQVAPIIENGKKPFYTFMVTQSSHGPFDLPAQYRDLKLDDSIDKSIIGDYLQSIHYTDKVIGEFLDELNKKGILKDTLVVIYGDHTGVHKFYPDKLQAVQPAQDWWVNDDMEIPLIIYNPSAKGEVFNVESGQIDVMPTIEYLLGVSKDQYINEAQGKVLVNTKKKYTILEDYTMYGDYTDEDAKHAKDGILLSDIMIQNNYFRNK